MNNYKITFNEFSLDVRNFNLTENQFIYGKNGAGKSTLLKLIAGFYSNNACEAISYFHDQDLGLYSHASGLDNLKLFNVNIDSEIFNIWKMNCRVFSIALKCQVSRMSLGMKKIIKLFLFFNSSAEVLLLDEVFSNFDKDTESFIVDQIINTKFKTFILTGHKAHEKFKSLEIDGGRIVN